MHLITCSRCGKENQDHYKFCLGCGNELVKPAPSVPVSHANGDGSLETARTVLPPAGGGAGAQGAGLAMTAAAGELREPSASSRPKGGIPWGDSPKMPAPVPFNLPPNPLAGPTGTPPVEHGPGRQPGRRGEGRGPAGGRRNGGRHQLPQLWAARAAWVRFLRRLRHAHRRASGDIRSDRSAATAAAVSPPRTAFMGGQAAVAPVAVPRGRLILIRPDGSEGGAHPLHDGDNLIGRGQAPLFDADAYLSPRHAELSSARKA